MDEPEAGEQRLFGRYRVLRELGRGAHGVVYQAWDEQEGAYVALKVPPADQDRTAALRFVREAYALAAVKSPHVVAIRRVVTGKDPLCAMEYVPGESVWQRVTRAGPLPEDDVCALLRGLLRALAALHGADLLHRDVKPGNVVLRHGAPTSPVLVDFGLARLREDLGLTAADVVVGTEDYLPPEVIHSGDVWADPRSDLFSAGLTARWALLGRTGYPPLKGMALLEQVERGLPPLDPGVARPELVGLLEALTARDPADRPATAEDALARLDAFDRAGNEPTRRLRKPSSQERGLVLVVEDDFDVREAARECLLAAGHRVVTAGSAEDALSILDITTTRIQAVVCDLNLPRLGGRELVARIRQVHPGAAIVLMTGAADQHAAPEVLPKPFTAAALCDALAAAIDGLASSAGVPP